MTYAFEEHTSELRLRLDAATLPELFVEAGRALGEALGARQSTAKEDTQEVAVRARDLETLLCAWIDELIFQTERSGLIYDVLRIEELGHDHLRASIRGGSMSEARLQVKAATLHGLKIEEVGGRLTAQVVLDV